MENADFLWPRVNREWPAPSPPFCIIFRIIELEGNSPQHRESKGLDTKIFETNGLQARRWGSPDRHGLDHDRATSMAGARSDVTGDCGFGERGIGTCNSRPACGQKFLTMEMRKRACHCGASEVGGGSCLWWVGLEIDAAGRFPDVSFRVAGDSGFGGGARGIRNCGSA